MPCLESYDFIDAICNYIDLKFTNIYIEQLEISKNLVIIAYVSIVLFSYVIATLLLAYCTIFCQAIS